MTPTISRSYRVFLAPALLLLAIYLFNLSFYLHYFPYGDDPALLQASAGSPVRWFTEGFSRFFLVYPGWSTPQTDFARPLVNLIVRCEQLLAGQHYSLYFAAYFLAQLVLCGTSMLAARLFGVSAKWQIAIGCFIAISPSFLGMGVLNIASHFDLWCGLFAMLAFYWTLRERYALALAALTLAVFTKEPALYAPIAACLTVFWRTRRKDLSAGMLLPLVAWFAVRRFVFAGAGGGIYVFQSHHLSYLLTGVLKGLLQWPGGVLGMPGVIKIIAARSPLASPVDAVLIVLNAVLWCFLLAAAFSLLKELRVSGAASTGSLSPLLLLLWLCGALSFGVLAGDDPRFGGSIYPLLVLFCAVMLHHARGRIERRLAALSLAILTFIFLWSGGNTVRLSHRDPLTSEEQMRAFIGAVQQHAARADTIYVLNAPDGYSNPESLATLAHVSAKIVLLDQARGCTQSSGGSTLLTETAQGIHISSTLPDCAELTFENVPPSVFASALPGSVARPQVGLYTFPSGRVAHRSLRGADTFLPDFGRQVDIAMASPPSAAVYLWYDWPSASYRCAGASCQP